MQHIETVTVGSGGAASITFMAVGDIPSDYTDLVVMLSGRSSHSGTVDDFIIAINGSTSNFSYRHLYGDGSSAGSYGTTTNYQGWVNGNTSTANTFGSIQLYIPNYRSAVAKSISNDHITENNATTSYQGLISSLWNVTDPITSITLDLQNGNFMEHSSASLYGITAGSDGIVTVS